MTPSAGPGDPVAFSAVHLDPGAEYAVSIGGRVVVNGTASGGTIAGSFPMPDLGSSGVYYAELRVEHEDGTWISTQPVRFAAAAPAPALATPPAVHARASVPAARPGPRPVANTPVVSSARKAPPPTTASKPPTRRNVRATRPVYAKHVRTRHRAAYHVLLPAPVSVRLRRELPVAVGQPRASIAQPQHLRLPVVLLLGLALIVVTLAAALTIVLLRRRAARRRDLRVEAELQELIAEARAAEGASLRSD